MPVSGWGWESSSGLGTHHYLNHSSVVSLLLSPMLTDNSLSETRISATDHSSPPAPTVESGRKMVKAGSASRALDFSEEEVVVQKTRSDQG